MKDIRTTDYVSEYEFRRSSGPKYQTSSLRPAVQKRKKGEDRYPEGRRPNRTKRKERMRKDTDSTEVEGMTIDEDNQSSQSGYRIPSNSDRVHEGMASPNGPRQAGRKRYMNLQKTG